MTSDLIAAFLVGAAAVVMLLDMAPPPGPIRMDPSEARPHPYGDPRWGGAKYPGCRGRRPQWLWNEWCGSA